MTEDKHRFRIEGAAAESLVQDLAAKSFFIDWCFPNPKLPDGRELCDLLVVFDDIAIIWQIKNVKLRKDGYYSKKEVTKNIRQILGARRQLFERKTPISLKNSRRHTEMFDPSAIREVYLISVLAGEGELDSNLAELKGDQFVHMFTGAFLEIALNELNTVGDFVQYLKAKEAYLKSVEHLQIHGGEEELLAFFLIHGRSFEELVGAHAVVFDYGNWQEFEHSPEYLAKKQADHISYGWDEIVDRIHERGSEKYELVARELARPNRFQRRVLAKVFYDAHMAAHQNTECSDLRRVMPWDNGRTYCFVFKDEPEPRKHRKALLETLCLVARVKCPKNQIVVGVATEKTFKPTTSYDYCLSIMPEITPEVRRRVEEIQKETGLLTDLTEETVHEDEYPSGS